MSSTTAPTSASGSDGSSDRARRPGRHGSGRSSEKTPGQLRLLLRCAHPKQAVLLAVVMAVGAALSGRDPAEVAVVGGGVLLAQLIAGLLNDVCDESLDRRADVRSKPIAEGWVPRGNATFAALALAILLIPMSLQSGALAGGLLLGSVVLAAVHDRLLHRTPLSFVGWVGTGVLYAWSLAAGGWGLETVAGSPAPLLLATGGLLGLALHLLTSLRDLPADRAAGIRPFPLVLALRLRGAVGLLVLSVLVSAGSVALLVLTALSTGLHP